MGDFVGAKFYCPHALAGGIRIREKMLELSTAVSVLSPYHKDTIILSFNKDRDNGFRVGSDMIWTICKQAAPCCRQLTMPNANLITHSHKHNRKNI